MSPAAVVVRATSPNLSREDLESLLRVRKLDHTLGTPFAAPGLETEPSSDDAVRTMVPTGIPDLDVRLRGGIPRGQLSEFIGPRSSGRLAMVMSALAGATRRGEAVALVDPLDMFDPISAAASGVDFSRMLWVRGEATSSSRVSLSCEYGTLQKTLDRAVKSLNLILQAGGFGVVVLDLAEIGSHVLRRLPFTTWLRLHRVIEGSDTACVLMGSDPIARTAGGVTVELKVRETRGLRRSRGEERSYATHATDATHEPVYARVIRSRAMESERDVCVPLSAAAC